MSLRFEEFCFDSAKLELSRNGEAIQVKPRALELLELLIIHKDRVVLKQEIMDTLWEGRIVSDASLTTTVKELRHALGDSGKQGRFIRTFYGRGLRFIAPIASEVGKAEVRKTPSPAATDAPGSSLFDRSTAEADPNPTFGVSRDTVPLSLAVLPFDTLSGDRDQRRMVEAIAGDLILALSKYRLVSTVSRTSSFAMAGWGLPVADIATALNAHYICEGRLRMVEDAARVTVDLIDARKDTHIWANQYMLEPNGPSGDFEDRIGDIASQIIVEINRYEGLRAFRAPFETLDAWGCYHRAQHILTTRSLETRDDDIINALERSIKLEPSFALAHALLAYCLSFVGHADTHADISDLSARTIQADLTRAEAAARHAMELDSRCAFASAALSAINLARGQHLAALKAAEASIRINPTLPIGHMLLAKCHRCLGNTNAAAASADQCIALASGSMYEWVATTYKAMALTAMGNHDQAIALSLQANAQSQTLLMAQFVLISALGHKGQKEAAREAIRHSGETQADIGIERFEKLLPIADPNVRTRIIEGFVRAGLVSVESTPDNDTANTLGSKLPAGPSKPAVEQGEPSRKNLPTTSQQTRGDPPPLNVFETLAYNTDGSIAAEAPITSRIAVLPFEALSNDDETALIAAGLFDEMNFALSRFRDPAVVPRTSTNAVSNTATARQIGIDLDARYLVQGNIRSLGSRHRFVISLVDGVTSRELWTERIEGQSDDQFKLLDEVTKQAVTSIIPSVYRAERIRVSALPNGPETASEFFHLGVQLLLTFEAEQQVEACRFFQKAIDIDRSFTSAFAYLAWSLTLKFAGEVYTATDRASLPRDRSDLHRAYAIAHEAVRNQGGTYDCWLSLSRAAIALGKQAESIEAGNNSVKLNIYSPNALVTYASALLHSGRPKEALEPIRQAKELIKSGPNFWRVLAFEAQARALMGEVTAALELSRAAQAERPRTPVAFIGEILAHGQEGRPDLAERLLADLKQKGVFITIERFGMVQPFTDVQVRETIFNWMRAAGVPEY